MFDDCDRRKIFVGYEMNAYNKNQNRDVVDPLPKPLDIGKVQFISYSWRLLVAEYVVDENYAELIKQILQIILVSANEIVYPQQPCFDIRTVSLVEVRKSYAI